MSTPDRAEQLAAETADRMTEHPDVTALLQYAETCDLAVGQRVRCRRLPHLTGRIKHYEWQAPGVLSGIPYNVAWDNSSRAYDELGMFALWQTDKGIEAIPDE